MRVLALDIGEKRIGVAVSDPGAHIATPVTVLDAARVLGGRELARLLEDYDDVGTLLVGLPVSLSGEEGPQARRVRAVAERIAETVGLPVVYADERMSSIEAERRMAESGLDSRARRGQVDMVAASILLQTYLDSMRSQQ